MEAAEVLRREPVTPVGLELRAGVGEVVAQSGVLLVQMERTARLLDPASADLDAGHTVRLGAGFSGPLVRRSVGNLPALCFQTSGAGNAALMMTGGGRASACLVDVQKSGLFDQAMFSLYERYFALAAPARYSVSESEVKRPAAPGAVRQQLVYAGASNGAIRLSYREFTADGMARASFSQELVYAMSPSGVTEVGFRSLRMRVLRADNTTISFVVDQPLD